MRENPKGHPKSVVHEIGVPKGDLNGLDLRVGGRGGTTRGGKYEKTGPRTEILVGKKGIKRYDGKGKFGGNNHSCGGGKFGLVKGGTVAMRK